MVKYLKPVPASRARGIVEEVYSQIKHDFGTLGEPLILHSPIPDLLTGVWCSFKECLLAGTARRELRETVAVAVSRINRCPYCLDAHTVMLRGAEAHSAAAVIRHGREEEIQDEQMRALAVWAAASRTRESPALLSPPFSPGEAPEFIGTAVWTHYINRMVKVFLGERLLPLASDPLGVRTAVERMGGWYFARFIRRPSRPGSTGRMLPEVDLPGDLSWAAASPAIARAYAAFAAAAEKAGKAALPVEVRECVERSLCTWNGADPGPGRDWLEAPLGKIKDAWKPAARLALLAAFAPYRVDPELIGSVRMRNPGDEHLLGSTAWASLAAARKIGTWISDRQNQTNSSQ